MNFAEGGNMAKNMKTKMVGRRPLTRRRKGNSGKAKARVIRGRRERKRRKKQEEAEQIKNLLANGIYF